MRLLLTLVASALLVAALAAAAPAPAATWSAPQNLSAAANDLSTGVLGVDKRGRALVAWPVLRWQSGKPHGHYVSDGWRSATRPPGAAAFDLQRSAPSFVSGPVLYGVSRAVGLDRPSGGWARCGDRGTLRARFGDSTGVFEKPRTIASYLGPGGDGWPALAANDSGVVMAAWSQATTSDCRGSAIRISLRRPGGAGFSAPATVAQGSVEHPSVAVGAGGDLLVAWERRIGNGRTVIEARVRQAGHRWGTVWRLGQATVAGPLTTAVAQNGRAYVAWGLQDINESTGLTLAFFAAVRPAGSTRFRATQTLERVRTPVAYLPATGPRIALAGTSALIAWTGHDSAWRVRVATSGADARIGSPQSVSPAGSDAVLGAVAALPDGAAAVAWSGLDSESIVRDVRVAVRPAGGVFGAPELVNDGALRQPSVALDPTTRRPTVTWPQRLGPTNSVAAITAYVRASTRSDAP